MTEQGATQGPLATGTSLQYERVPSPEQFVRYVGQLQALAEHYSADADHGALVLQFLRHTDYASFQWRALVGPVDEEFVRRVDDAGIEQIRAFRDPVFPVAIKTSHLAAACTGVYQHGQPQGTDTNRGDVTGWAGDWITFYGDWRRDHGDFRSGYDYAQAVLMRADVESTFRLTDLVEDADGYTIGMKMRAGERISTIVDGLYGGRARQPRLLRFFQNRFGDEVTAQGAAMTALRSDTDRLVQLGRLYLVESVGGLATPLPNMLPGEQLGQLCRGFSDVLLRTVRSEAELLAGRRRPRL
jgi:hypothetical protein